MRRRRQYFCYKYGLACLLMVRLTSMNCRWPGKGSSTREQRFPAELTGIFSVPSTLKIYLDLTPVSSWACLASPPLWSAKWRLEKAATRIVQNRTVSSHPPLCTSHAAFQADTCANPGLPQWIVKNALATCYILSSCLKATPGFDDELYSETNLLIHYPSVIPIAKLGPYSCSDPIFRRVGTQSEAAPHASNLPFATIDQIYYTNIPL